MISRSQTDDLVFATSVFPNASSVTSALLLVESIREFAGTYADSDIWCYVPDGAIDLVEGIKDRMSELRTEIIPFTSIDRFPFSDQLVAAANAEKNAVGRTKFLAWIAANTVILKEPTCYNLPDDKKLGYRPVHHTLVGSRSDENLDEFWSNVYGSCNVTEDRIFTMNTHVDDTLIRPYFNAGSLIVRPEENVLTATSEKFHDVYKTDVYKKFYEQDDLYAIFIHQAILTGVIMSTYTSEEMIELPHTYNYPIHLYEEDVTENRPSSLEELVTFRHEGFHMDPQWMEKMPANNPLKKWLSDHLR